MRHREQRLWDRMRKMLSGEFYLERVENIVMPGRPDVDVVRKGIVLPVELKAKPSMPTRATTPVLGTAAGLNPYQLNWWLRWQKVGGRGFILVAIGDRMFAVPGAKSEFVNAMTPDQIEQHSVTWQSLAERLCRAGEELRRQL